MRIRFKQINHMRTDPDFAGPKMEDAIEKRNNSKTFNELQADRNQFFQMIIGAFNKLDGNQNSEVIIPVYPGDTKRNWSEEELKNLWLDRMLQSVLQVKAETQMNNHQSKELMEQAVERQVNQFVVKKLKTYLGRQASAEASAASSSPSSAVPLRPGARRVRGLVPSRRPASQYYKELLSNYKSRREADQNEYHGFFWKYQGNHKSRTVKLAAAEILDKALKNEEINLEDYGEVTAEEIKSALKDGSLRANAKFVINMRINNDEYLSISDRRFESEIDRIVDNVFAHSAGALSGPPQ